MKWKPIESLKVPESWFSFTNLKVHTSQLTKYTGQLPLVSVVVPNPCSCLCIWIWLCLCLCLFLCLIHSSKSTIQANLQNPLVSSLLMVPKPCFSSDLIPSPFLPRENIFSKNCVYKQCSLLQWRSSSGSETRQSKDRYKKRGKNLAKLMWDILFVLFEILHILLFFTFLITHTHTHNQNFGTSRSKAVWESDSVSYQLTNVYRGVDARDATALKNMSTKNVLFFTVFPYSASRTRKRQTVTLWYFNLSKWIKVIRMEPESQLKEFWMTWYFYELSIHVLNRSSAWHYP